MIVLESWQIKESDSNILLTGSMDVYPFKLKEVRVISYSVRENYIVFYTRFGDYRCNLWGCKNVEYVGIDDIDKFILKAYQFNEGVIIYVKNGYVYRICYKGKLVHLDISKEVGVISAKGVWYKRSIQLSSINNCVILRKLNNWEYVRVCNVAGTCNVIAFNEKLELKENETLSLYVG